MAEFNARVESFMARFGATKTQAIYLLRDEADKSDRTTLGTYIASRIMQDDAFKQIGYDYMDRNPDQPGENPADAYRRVMAQMTADILDEVFDVMPKDTPTSTATR